MSAGDLDFLTVFLQGNSVQASPMSQQLVAYSGFPCLSFLVALRQSEYFYKSGTCGQREAQVTILRTRSYTVMNSLRLCHSLWTLGGLDGLFLVTATSPDGHLCYIGLSALRPMTCPSLTL